MDNLSDRATVIQTFLYNQADLLGENIVVEGEEGHHISRVLRMKPGDAVRLIDGSGTAHSCEIGDIKGDKVVCRIIKTVRFSGEASINLTLAVALSESSKFKTIIEKGTEVGVHKFIPLYSEKSKIDFRSEAVVKRKLIRWQRIATAAAKQSGRSVIPSIDSPQEFISFVNQCDFKICALFHPQSQINLTKWLAKTSAAQEITAIIGPESGLSPKELEAAQTRQIPIVSLGERVLRTETAGTVIPALIIYLAESGKNSEL